MSTTREQLDKVLNHLEDSIPGWISRGCAITLENQVRSAAEQIESKVSQHDRRHYEARLRLILWNAGIF